MDQRHGFIYAIESQQASAVVHVNPDTGDLFRVQRRLHVAVPSREAAAVPLETPGEVVPCDAAVALVAFAVDAFVSDAHVRALAANVGFKVVPPQVEALSGQDLAPVLKAFGDVGVRVLPGRGVGHFPVFSSQAQELVGCVWVQTQVGGICKTISKRLFHKTTGCGSNKTAAVLLF